MTTILFWGPLGKPGKAVTGGGETGNLRTINMLSKNNIRIISVRKPYPPKRRSFVSPFTYSFALLLSVIKFAYYCLLSSHRPDVAQVSAFYGKLVYFEFLMLLFAKTANIPFVYEIRGGAMLKYYNRGSWLYKYIFSIILKKSDAIFSQGLEYNKFILKKSGNNPTYYPNYVDSSHIKNSDINNGRNKSDQIKLIYFGRIVSDKGVETAIRTCAYLQRSGINNCLQIIGEGQSDYIKYIVSLAEELEVGRFVSIDGPVPFSIIKKKLQKSHFFLFPTFNQMEGHSNALTEAMAFGVVPICSKQGFNETVVGNCGKILSITAGESEYAHSIQDIWENNQWSELSSLCRRTVEKKFTSEVVMPNIFIKYQQVINSNQ